MSELRGVVCGPHTSVPGETGCYDADWSEGRACRTCDHSTCYRRGWLKARVVADHDRRVATGYKGSDAGAPAKIVAARFVCHSCGRTVERLWRNVRRHWPRCCKALMSETAIATEVTDAG